MPAAVPIAVAGVTAVGGIINAKMQSNAAKRAAAAQQQTATQGIDYQKGRDQITDQRYMDVWNDYKARHAAWEQRNFGAKTGGGGRSAVSSGFTPTAALAPGQLTPLAMGADQGTGAPSEGATVADIGPWNDWRRYGVS